MASGMSGIPPNAPKFVPLKRGLWFEINSDRWFDVRQNRSITFFEIHWTPLIWVFVIFNFALAIYRYDPDGPPLGITQDGKFIGVVYPETPVTSHQSPVTGAN